MAAGSDQVAAIRECHLLEEPLERTWPLLSFDAGSGISRVGLRLGVEEDIQLILESDDPAAPEFSVEELPISAVHVSPAGELVLAGSACTTMQVKERLFQVSAGSFFQVNTAMAGRMVDGLLKGLGLRRAGAILDVYCGVGLFSAFLAPLAGRLVGIESSPPAVEDFETNLAEFDHVEIYEATAGQALPAIGMDHAEVVVVDPPRSGLERPALDAILALKPGLLAYISCDPATLSRDARRLVEGGYELVEITPYDFFPQTYHIESLSFWRAGRGGTVVERPALG
jgi:23S rRNA (uracil1939-C5)-methyltransferase